MCGERAHDRRVLDPRHGTGTNQYDGREHRFSAVIALQQSRSTDLLPQPAFVGRFGQRDESLAADDGRWQ